jgi:hypothetical protein
MYTNDYNEYQSSFNKGTLNKMKGEFFTAVFIYGFSKILAKIITILLTPFIFITYKAGRAIYNISERIIPKNVDELVTEYKSDLEEKELKTKQEYTEREFQRLFIEWKKGKK